VTVALTGAVWSAHLRLPESAGGKLARWTLKVSFAGTAQLSAASVTRTLA
jgi:hypothetical protein